MDGEQVKGIGQVEKGIWRGESEKGRETGQIIKHQGIQSHMLNLCTLGEQERQVPFQTG